ncbi:MAG: bifunctional UDP-N-acetylglucosamine diphosphorylase/glucosamine-1-phosphate N-acetyltransferase GlmU [Nitrospiraceae bacterium]
MKRVPQSAPLDATSIALRNESGVSDRVAVIIMAAGLGKRMQSKVVKVLHPVAGRPMVLYAVELGRQFGDRGVAVVVGHQGDRVRAVLEAQSRRPAGRPPLHIVVQEKQLGTGDAVRQACPVFVSAQGSTPLTFLILNGDTPLLTKETVEELLRVHRQDGATVTLLTAVLDDPTGYGRVVRAEFEQGARSLRNQAVLRIVEDRDATPAEAALREINVGTYVVEGSFLFEALDQIRPQNAQGEYYLTDIVGLAVAQGRPVAAVRLQEAAEGLGVNTRAQLAEAERTIRERIRAAWLEAGVTMKDPATTWIDADVRLGRDTVLYPQVTLEGQTRIGEDCVIRSHARLTDCVVGDRVEILDSCVLRESQVEDEAHLGPFAHLRPGTVVRRQAKVGNFVEIKKAELGEGSKANHLSYLGDAVIGKGVNIGAGTITCNYDGVKKYQTVIENDVFVGSDTQLVAPVRIGCGALIAAGTTVTQDVPPNALAIGRASQVNRPGWATKRRMLAESGKPVSGARSSVSGSVPTSRRTKSRATKTQDSKSVKRR